MKELLRLIVPELVKEAAKALKRLLTKKPKKQNEKNELQGDNPKGD
jgi:hypothetical protein